MRNHEDQGPALGVTAMEYHAPARFDAPVG